MATPSQENSSETNKTVVRQFITHLMEAEDITYYDTLIHPEAKRMYPKPYLKLVYKYFEFQTDVDLLIEENNTVVVYLEITVRCKKAIPDKHQQNLWPFKKGQQTTYKEVMIFRLDDGRISSLERIFDTFEFYTQTGILDNMRDQVTNERLVEYLKRVQEKLGETPG